MKTEQYNSLVKIAKTNPQIGAKNWRVSTNMPYAWGCDDKDLVALVGWIYFTPGEISQAGFGEFEIAQNFAALPEQIQARYSPATRAAVSELLAHEVAAGVIS